MPCGQLRVMNFEFLPHPSFWGYGTLYVGTHAMRPQATGQIQMIRNTCYGFIAESYPPFLGRGWGRGFFMRPYIQGVPPLSHRGVWHPPPGGRGTFTLLQWHVQPHVLLRVLQPRTCPVSAATCSVLCRIYMLFSHHATLSKTLNILLYKVLLF